MLAAVALMVLTSPGYAPAPVYKEKDKFTGRFLGGKWEESRINLDCNGRVVSLEVAPKLEVTINGAKGYGIDDLGEISPSQEAIVVAKVKGGVVRSMDIKLELANGRSLWQPGNGRDVQFRRWVQEQHSEAREKLRRLTGGNP